MVSNKIIVVAFCFIISGTSTSAGSGSMVIWDDDLVGGTPTHKTPSAHQLNSASKCLKLYSDEDNIVHVSNSCSKNALAKILMHLGANRITFIRFKVPSRSTIEIDAAPSDGPQIVSSCILETARSCKP